jgi:hypothetical protein
LIGAYHYLGYGQGPGEQLKYVIALKNRPLGAIGFSAAAWRVACRDRFMAWHDHARQKNLHLLVNNHRFLILPWTKIAKLVADQTSLSLSPRFEFSSTLANDVSTASKKKTLHPEAATLFTK